MFKVRAKIFKKGKNGSISFEDDSRNTFEKEVDAWNYLDKFKKIIENFYDMKGYVKCYVVSFENGKEILKCRL